MSDAAAQMPARILVTGSSDGIGAAIADALVTRGMDVVRHARNERRAEQCRDRAGAPIEVVVGDYASLESTKALAAQITALGPFDVIVHNAGWASSGEERPVTVDGIEQTLQVNALAPYVLTAAVPLPRRLVYLSSDSIRNAHLDLADLQHERSWDAGSAYADSKLALTAFVLHAARRFPKVAINAVHPGWVRSKMSGDMAPLSLEQGADTSVWLACAQDPAAQVTGFMFHDRAPVRYNEQAHDTAVQDAVVRVFEKLSGFRLPGEAPSAAGR
jgi:NAD(P)-dependent dehydrogenase (short-subunit alcohol dehydrogenase family)